MTVTVKKLLKCGCGNSFLVTLPSFDYYTCRRCGQKVYTMSDKKPVKKKIAKKKTMTEKIKPAIETVTRFMANSKEFKTLVEARRELVRVKLITKLIKVSEDNDSFMTDQDIAEVVDNILEMRAEVVELLTTPGLDSNEDYIEDEWD